MGKGAGLESKREKSGSLSQSSALGLLGNLGGPWQGSRQAVERAGVTWRLGRSSAGHEQSVWKWEVGEAGDQRRNHINSHS